MSFWPKSRYTASLEEQVRDLKAEVLRLQKENSEMTRHILSALPGPPPTLRATDKDKQDVPLPKAVNWLRARGSLESTDLRIEEHIDKEKSANGSR